MLSRSQVKPYSERRADDAEARPKLGARLDVHEFRLHYHDVLAF